MGHKIKNEPASEEDEKTYYCKRQKRERYSREMLCNINRESLSEQENHCKQKNENQDSTRMRIDMIE